MNQEDEIREILNQAAQAIAQAQNNPRTWLSWLVHLLARLEDEATKTGTSGHETYLEMLSALQNEIRNRTRTGGWN